ncbi:MAG: hypothetical protein KF767_15665 [Bdellovibrionaceae bacterium]|nr:hypothetical protein [Pseudobdellovibrionaceae bacterium]
MNNAELPFYQKSNTVMLAVMALNIPVMLLTAVMSGTSFFQALGWSLAILAGPTLSWMNSRGSVLTSILLGMSSMMFSGLNDPSRERHDRMPFSRFCLSVCPDLDGGTSGDPGRGRDDRRASLVVFLFTALQCF